MRSEAILQAATISPVECYCFLLDLTIICCWSPLLECWGLSFVFHCLNHLTLFLTVVYAGLWYFDAFCLKCLMEELLCCYRVKSTLNGNRKQSWGLSTQTSKAQEHRPCYKNVFQRGYVFASCWKSYEANFSAYLLSCCSSCILLFLMLAFMLLCTCVIIITHYKHGAQGTDLVYDVYNK